MYKILLKLNNELNQFFNSVLFLVILKGSSIRLQVSTLKVSIGFLWQNIFFKLSILFLLFFCNQVQVDTFAASYFRHVQVNFRNIKICLKITISEVKTQFIV